MRYLEGDELEQFVDDALDDAPGVHVSAATDEGDDPTDRALLVAALSANSPYGREVLETANESLLRDLAVMEVTGFTANSDPALFAEALPDVSAGQVHTPGDPNRTGTSDGSVTANTGDDGRPVDDNGEVDVDALVDDISDGVIPDVGEE